MDDFLDWSKDEGDYYWIWGGALEWSNGGVNPKDIIKGLPFIKLPSDLLVDAWLRFLNSDPRLMESMWQEYRLILRRSE